MKVLIRKIVEFQVTAKFKMTSATYRKKGNYGRLEMIMRRTKVSFKEICVIFKIKTPVTSNQHIRILFELGNSFLNWAITYGS